MSPVNSSGRGWQNDSLEALDKRTTTDWHGQQRMHVEIASYRDLDYCASASAWIHSKV